MPNKPIQVEILAEDAIVNVNLSARFLGRMQGLLLYLTQQHSPDKLKASIDKIKEGSATLDPWEAHLETMMIFIGSVEDKARKDGLLTLKDIQPT
jgi:hypothetical protein